MSEHELKPKLNSSFPLGKDDTTIQKTPLSISSSESEESPFRAIICLKNRDDVQRFEETEECFILDFDPFESVDLSKLSMKEKITVGDHDTNTDNDSDLSVIAEKGQVACRDYPHSRHLCLKFPFETNPHESYCKLCYCYVCDSAAPCKYWTDPIIAHCHASESVGDWKLKRTLSKQPSAVLK
ncbi:28 kDa ribonucleoprotein, chloroplastic [Quillaja saponaria]|uniref:28 kDa ribonucleoprotein, chloroplastic n=1 Tax=Quillaja saponaria TaxID=32244 RepID=A0AAD7PR78_QUISA|nr:28 kDa ribonucleoprotein, chloroplastic [Quillaja saponaria]